MPRTAGGVARHSILRVVRKPVGNANKSAAVPACKRAEERPQAGANARVRATKQRTCQWALEGAVCITRATHTQNTLLKTVTALSTGQALAGSRCVRA